MHPTSKKVRVGARGGGGGGGKGGGGGAAYCFGLVRSFVRHAFLCIT